MVKKVNANIENAIEKSTQRHEKHQHGMQQQQYRLGGGFLGVSGTSPKSSAILLPIFPLRGEADGIDMVDILVEQYSCKAGGGSRRFLNESCLEASR